MKCLNKVETFSLGFVLFLLIQNSNGLFECILIKFEPMVKNSEIFNLDEFKIARFNRTTFVFNGTMEMSLDSFEDLEAGCQLFKKAGNDYKLTPYKMGPANICKLIKEDEFFYAGFHNYTNFPPLKTCDFKKGVKYNVKNYLPDMSRVPPVFESGDYMVECKIFKGGEFIQGTVTYSQMYNIANAGLGKYQKPGDSTKE